MSSTTSPEDPLPIHCTPGAPPFPDEHLPRLAQLARSVMADHPVSGEVQLVLADNVLVQGLNAAYRGRDEPTDVLSFDLNTADGPAECDMGGEIYVSLERARQQADEQQVGLLEEVARLLTHGLLHLAGYEHDTPETLDVMQVETDRLLRAAGLLGLPTPPKPALAGRFARKE